MDFLNNIKTDTLIICNDYIKKEILKINKLLPIKIMNIKKFKENYFFKYDENTIIHIMNKYNIKYEIAKVYLDNLYYIEDKLYNNQKLDFLVSLKKDLDCQKLLKYNKNFDNYLKRVNIITYNIKLDNDLKKILKKYNYKEIIDKKKNYNHIIYEFDTMEDEINYIANEIAKLIDKDVSPKNIKLMNVDTSYNNTIERIFNLYNLKPAINYKRLLSSYPITKEFIKLYQTNSLTESINKLDKNNEIYNEIIKVVNKYRIYENKELIIYKLNHTSISYEKYSNEIEIIDYLEYPYKDNEYYFLIGFNETLIPKYYTDTEYLTDNIKTILNLKTTKQLNTELKETIINNIKNIKNLTITYKLKDNIKNYYKSPLAKYFNVEKKELDNTISYSKTNNEIRLAKEYDNYQKYGSISELLKILNNNYQIKYNSFSNKYTKINTTIDKFNLSYTKLDTYNKCAFKYYLSNILKLDIFEETFATTIGSMTHYIMEKCLSNSDNNIDKYASEFLKDKELTKKEIFFIDKYKKEISSLLEEIKLEKEYTKLDKAMYEKRINIEIDNNINFNGIIDKILYYEDKINTYIAIIDYKTGNDDINLKYFKYGINIQLPIYLYLVSTLPFKNPIYTGFYLQKLNIIDKDCRLLGYSNQDKEILSYLDNNYQNSKIIKGLKTLKDGSFSKHSKVLTNEDIQKIIKNTNIIIKDVINKIKNNKFDINPKIIDNKNISCEYCKFKDICFKTKEDEQLIEVSDGDNYDIY